MESIAARLLADAATRATNYLDGLDARAVAPSAEAVRALGALGGPLPDEGDDPATVLALLDEFVSPATMASAGRRFFGFVVGGALPAAVGAAVLATAWDQDAGLYQLAPGPSYVEEVALAWCNSLFGFPATTGGAFVTGATMANFTALVTARDEVLARAGWDARRDGLIGAPPVTVVVGGEAHPSVRKALGLAGLGRNATRSVEVDPQGRMRGDRFPDLDGPAIVCLQAGNVNSGAFDPFGELIGRAHDAGAWVHVDGAFGLWAATAPLRRHLVAGVEDADSWATDLHKWLNAPYDSGLALVRDADALRASMAVEAAYLPPTGDVREPGMYTPELSRRARGVDAWAALRSLGRSGVAELVERCCAHATRFADELRGAGYEVLNDVVLNQVVVSFGDAATTHRVIAGVQDDGTCWCGPTEWRGRTAMRVSVCSWATTDADVDRSTAAILRVAKSVRG
jgi:glutamate/tyrosine decarboxylase-like PLP-dependent enzyme